MRTTPPPRAEFWIMPDLIGSNLAEAKGAISFVTYSSRGVRTTSIDATGQGRNGPPDTEWRVRWQSPAGGDWIGPGSVVSFCVALDADVGMSSTGGTDTATTTAAPRQRIHPQSDD
ncbi:MAG: hypothetical protein M3400_02085 [Actinomycetota bacterium]|nr:hypothetical protein [Actinomycetota bacterium]